MPKYYLLFLFSFLSISTLFSQFSTQKRTIIYNKDGSFFIGKILKDHPSSIEMIKTTGDTLNIHKRQIKRIFQTSRDIIMHTKGSVHYTSGIFASTSFGWGLSEDHSFDWDLVVGRHLNEKWSVGLGASVNYNTTNNFRGIRIDNRFTPIFAYGRYYINKKSARLFAFSRLGYGFGFFSDNIEWVDNQTGGVHIQPGIGVHFASRKSIRFIITLSQMLQHTRGSQVDFDFLSNPINIDYNFFYNRTMLKVGIEFK